MGRFVIREYTIKSCLLKKNVTAVLLSDLHNCVYGKENEKLIGAIRDIQPDLVLSAGDMLTAKKGRSFHVALEFMKKLAKSNPVYYGLGNHEYRMKIYPEDYGTAYEDYMSQIRNSGIHVLDNESVYVDDLNIEITGLSIERRYYKRFKKTKMEKEYIPSVVGNVKENAFHILLAHNPEYYDEYDEWGADLVLSGHVHGGVMRLPLLGGVISPKLVLFPKYDGGEFNGKNGTMILSRGLGVHTIPIRIFNPPELVVLHLEKN